MININKYDIDNLERYFKEKLQPDAEKLKIELEYIRCALQNNEKVNIKNLLNGSLVRRLLKLNDFNLMYVAQNTVGVRKRAEFIVLIRNWYNLD